MQFFLQQKPSTVLPLELECGLLSHVDSVVLRWGPPVGQHCWAMDHTAESRLQVATTALWPLAILFCLFCFTIALIPGYDTLTIEGPGKGQHGTQAPCPPI